MRLYITKRGHVRSAIINQQSPFIECFIFVSKHTGGIILHVRTCFHARNSYRSTMTVSHYMGDDIDKAAYVMYLASGNLLGNAKLYKDQISFEDALGRFCGRASRLMKKSAVFKKRRW